VCGVSNAQIIDNSGCSAFTDLPFFDSLFIRKNKIVSIEGHVSTKADLKVIKKDNRMIKYEFDSLGRLTRQFGSFNTSGIKDTTFHSYFYDEDENLVLKRTSDSHGFYSYRYTHNAQGDVLSKTYCREENSGPNRYSFELGKEFTIVKETYSYSKNDSVVTKDVFNNHNRKYQVVKEFYNEFGLLSKVESKYLISKKVSRVDYKYGDLGLVISKITTKDVRKPELKDEIRYKYDEMGNLTYIDVFKKGVHETHQEILYDLSTYSLKALLVQNVADNFITIIKFSTSYKS